MILSKLIKMFGRLEITVFICGAIVMILELIGSRILAPYVGTSIYVWAALIGVILGALSIGYYAGGRISEKNPTFNHLTFIVFISGLLVLYIPVFKDLILEASASIGVKLGSITAAVSLFFLPSMLLGMVSPYALRLKISSIEKSGGEAGALYALSTIGSIAGTFLAGFYLIPTFGSTAILFALAIALVLTSCLGTPRWFKFLSIGIGVIIWATLVSVHSPYVYESDSAYNHIRVQNYTEKGTGQPLRALFLATELHSIEYVNSTNFFADYQKIYLLDSLFNPHITTALTLGGGAYVGPVNFLDRYPQASMTVVEIDPKVTAVAKQFFHLQSNSRLQNITEDARLFLNTNHQKFDAIYGDAFASYFSVPFHLTTTEAMRDISESLTDNGVFIFNIISALSGPQSLFFQAEYKTIAQFFPTIYIFPIQFDAQGAENSFQNIVIIATKSTKRLTKAELFDHAQTNEQREAISHLWTQPIQLGSVPMLTDDFAPVDNYISKLL